MPFVWKLSPAAREDYVDAGDNCSQDLLDACFEIDRLAAELKDVLEYAGHKPHCTPNAVTGYHRCTCGWDAMRERYAKGRA